MSSSFRLRSHPNRLLRDHLSGVAEKSESLVKSLLEICGQDLLLSGPTLQSMAHLMGTAHDVGKATQYFQDWLPPSKIRPRDSMLKAHSRLSSLYGYFAAAKLFSDSEYGCIIPSFVSLSIQSHHGALESPTTAAAKNLDWEHIAAQISAIRNSDELDEILEGAGLPTFSNFESQARPEVLRHLKTQATINREMKRLFREELTPFFVLNLLFSVLIDADRMDAAGLSFSERQRITSSLSAYVAQLSNQSRLHKKAEPTVAYGRDELFRIVTEKAMLAPLSQRIFSLTAPTGYGKTLAGLGFAVKLRERLSQNGYLPRIIYVAPYLSILDQNFERIAEAVGIGPTQSNILLLHHHLAEMQYQISDLSKESFSSLDSELLIEGWNAEIIVTSFIQFFYALIGSRPSQLRKFHKLAGSIVILDEVQTIPHEYWELIRETLKFIADNLKMYVILMTATQPLIFHKNEVFELAAELPAKSWKPRVSIKNRATKDLTLREFINKLNPILRASKNKSILIVMNTIGSATKVFNELKTPLKKYYLSANVVPAHRKDRIGKISEALMKRQPLVLVSTQVVEAGIDMDFDTVIRDMSPVDSIIQVAGRCNRSGLRKSIESEVYIYSVVDDKSRAHYANRIYGNYLIDRSKEVLSRIKMLDPFHLAREYYHAVQKGSSDLESRSLLKAMSDLDYGQLKDFKLIDEQPSCSVFVEIDEKASEIWGIYVRILESEEDSFERKERFLKIRGDFYNYVINVSERETSGLEQTRGFYRIPRSEIGVCYSEKTGFIPTGGPTKKPAYIY